MLYEILVRYWHDTGTGIMRSAQYQVHARGTREKDVGACSVQATPVLCGIRTTALCMLPCVFGCRYNVPGSP